MTWLAGLLGGWIAKAGLAFAALAATWLGGRMAGKTAAKIDNLQDEVKAHETRDKVDAYAGTGDAHERLRSRWTR